VAPLGGLEHRVLVDILAAQYPGWIEPLEQMPRSHAGIK
jgi:hypothetical protein